MLVEGQKSVYRWRHRCQTCSRRHWGSRCPDVNRPSPGSCASDRKQTRRSPTMPGDWSSVTNHQHQHQHFITITNSNNDPARYWLCSATSTNYSVPCMRTKFGDRAFSVAGPVMWNSLPAAVHHVDSLHSYKCRLKSHFFSSCFNYWQCNTLQVRFRAWRALNSLLLLPPILAVSSSSLSSSSSPSSSLL